MVILKSCCCWQSVRNGSIASAFYTLIFYTVVVTAGSFHVHEIFGVEGVMNFIDSGPVLLIFSIIMLALAAMAVMSSIVLIVGLCTNNRKMLLPWIIFVSMATLHDIILTFYLLSEAFPEIGAFNGVLVAIDYFVCGLNVYCILCVTSQYQEYTNRRTLPCRPPDPEVAPAICFEAPSTCRPNQSPARLVSVNVIRNNGSPTSTICRPLLSSSDSPRSPSLMSSNFIPTSSPALMLSRSSFSSTTEISFCSSDVLSASRRSSALPGQDLLKPGLSPVGEVNPFPSISAEPYNEEVEIENETQDVGEIETDASHTEASGSVFRVSKVFSGMKSTPKLTKIEMSELKPQPNEEESAYHTDV